MLFCREQIFKDLQLCRQLTLELVNGIDPYTLTTQSHPDFSPIGWHLGHIAFTEAYWILEQCAGLKPQFTQYHKLFRADGLPKAERQNLPNFEAILDYLATIRNQVLDYLEIAHLEQQDRLWRWLIQHESQHNETIAFVRELHRLKSNSSNINDSFCQENNLNHRENMIKIPEGDFLMGNNHIEAMDNEIPQHQIKLKTYYLDPYPVTCGEYQKFITSGGYQERKWWSKKGWQWLQQNPVTQPLYWSNNSLDPVCGVSWYEAEAYSNFIGKRLPTEAEWEKAASWNNGAKSCYPWGNISPHEKHCNHNCLEGKITPVNKYLEGKSVTGCWDFLGNIWEWTSSWFDGYSGFKHYPYSGYSQSYFDHKHRVLKGGSWATRPWGLRSSFRNWYHPEVRQIFAGFRCCVDH
jgi:gamma-glutamyl hercynylcysteine S-oxide synthase